MATILLVEDDQELTGSVAQALADVGFDVVTAPDSGQAVQAVYQTCPDMVLLDENLPPINGEPLCQYIRYISPIPIITLVGSEQGMASARFLEMGADACLVKRVSQRMLLARVGSLFRRCGTNFNYSLPPSIELDATDYQASLGDRIVDLTPTEFRLLNCLALNSDRLVPYAELAMGVWGREEVSPSNLKFYLCSLKKKLANGSDSDFDLLNHRGVGFRFVRQ
ncbi:MAG TPA: response regulator transcription factor [Dehalococcoidia bacterium]|nr:response regulator transcription factor [Dehalococcoidia bacterium]